MMLDYSSLVVIYTIWSISPIFGAFFSTLLESVTRVPINLHHQSSFVDFTPLVARSGINQKTT